MRKIYFSHYFHISGIRILKQNPEEILPTNPSWERLEAGWLGASRSNRICFRVISGLAGKCGKIEEISKRGDMGDS